MQEDFQKLDRFAPHRESPCRVPSLALLSADGVWMGRGRGVGAVQGWCSPSLAVCLFGLDNSRQEGERILPSTSFILSRFQPFLIDLLCDTLNVCVFAGLMRKLLEQKCRLYDRYRKASVLSVAVHSIVTIHRTNLL